MIAQEHRLNKLFEELVPDEGKADSLAGEIVRATTRIGYRFSNDGDMLGVGYGKETCNPAGRFLLMKAPKEIGGLVAGLWGMRSAAGYEAVLDILCDKVAEFIDSHPKMRETPTDDMWDYVDRDEDVDDEGWEDWDCEEEDPEEDEEF